MNERTDPWPRPDSVAARQLTRHLAAERDAELTEALNTLAAALARGVFDDFPYKHEIELLVNSVRR